MSLPLSMLSDWHIIVLAFLVCLLFGARNCRKSRGLGEAMREFKKASRDLHEERSADATGRQHRLPPSRPPQRPQQPSEPKQAKAFSSASVVFEEESVGRASGD